MDIPDSLNFEVPLELLYTAKFMSEHTKYGSFVELMSANDIDITSSELIETTVLDAIIQRDTDFDSYAALQAAAGNDFLQRAFKQT